MMMQCSAWAVGLVGADGTYQEVGNITPACVQAIRTARRPADGCRRTAMDAAYTRAKPAPATLMSDNGYLTPRRNT